ADGLEAVGASAGGEPVGQLGEGDTGPAGLAFGPFVAVEPDLGRIREVGADLDESGTELAVEDVEVVDADPALFLRPTEVGGTGSRANVFGGAVHPLELLSGHDGHDAATVGPLGSLQVGPDMIEFAVIPATAVRLLQRQDRDALSGGERFALPSEPIPDLLYERGRSEREAEVALQEVVDLRPDLQAGHVGVQIQPVDALHLQGHMTVEHVVDIHHARHRTSVVARGPAEPARQPWSPPSRA